MQDMHNIKELLKIQQEQIKEIKNTLAVIKTGMESLKDLNLTCYETNLDMKMRSYHKPPDHKVRESMRSITKLIRQIQARYIEKKIRKQFQDLHQFLEKEEEARISAVMNEKQSKMKMNIGRYRHTGLNKALLRIDESKHLDNLKLTVWKKMRKIALDNWTFRLDLKALFFGFVVGFICFVILIYICLTRIKNNDKFRG